MKNNFIYVLIEFVIIMYLLIESTKIFKD